MDWRAVRLAQELGRHAEAMLAASILTDPLRKAWPMTSCHHAYGTAAYGHARLLEWTSFTIVPSSLGGTG